VCLEGLRVYTSSDSYIRLISASSSFGNKMLYCIITGGREHTVSAEPGGHTSCYYLRQRSRYMFLPCSFVCLSVSEITQKRVHGFAWNVACRDKGNGLTFQPDPRYSPDAVTASLSPIALQHVILLRLENPTYTYWLPVAAATRAFKMVLFTASRRNTFVGGTCALPSALLSVTKTITKFTQCFSRVKHTRIIQKM